MTSNAVVSHFDSLKQVGYYFSYFVEGKEKQIALEHANVVDVQINWDVNELCVEGYVIFNDTYRTTEIMPPMVDIFFKIKASDFTFDGKNNNSKSTYEETFIITKMSREISNNKNLIVRVDFIDRLYFYMANTYLGKGYNNKKSTEVIESILTNKEGFGDIGNISKRTLNINHSDIVYDGIVIPQHQPLTAFIKSKELKDGFSFFQSRYSINSLSHNKLNAYLPDLYQKGKGIVFTYDDNDAEYNPYKIKTIKFLTADTFMLNVLMPDCIAYEFNQDNMSNPNKAFMNIANLAQDLDDSSTLTRLKATRGFRRTLVTNMDSIQRFYKFKLLENTLIEITVSGMFFYELFWKVGIDLKSTIDGYKGKMPHVNGGYRILRIIDKFSGTNFNQVITLGRVGVENVSNA